MEYFKILDHPKNAPKFDLSVSPTSVLEFKKRISGTKIYLTPFCFCEKSWNNLKYLTLKTNLNGPPTCSLRHESVGEDII